MARQRADGSWQKDKKDDTSATGFTYPTDGISEDTEAFQWGDVSSDVLARGIDAVTSRGHAISFAVNRSHTAGCITILAGAERPKYYPETVGQAERILLRLVSAEGA